MEIVVGVATSLLMRWVSRRENIKDGKPLNHGWYVWPALGLMECLLLLSGGWAAFAGWVFFGLLVVGVYGLNKDSRAVQKTTFSVGNECLDVICFKYEGRDDYIALSRSVDVSGVDGRYLEGFCQMRRDVRTFRLDRIKGEVVSLETGEVFASADAWSAANAASPRNKGVSPVPQDTWKTDH